MISYRYSQWDGSQEISEVSADELIDALSDRLTFDGDMLRALQRLFRFGLQNRAGERLQGIQDLLQKLRALRRQTLDKYNISSVPDEIRQRLDEVIRTEKEGIERRLGEAWTSRQDEDFVKALENVAAKNLSLRRGGVPKRKLLSIPLCWIVTPMLRVSLITSPKLIKAGFFYQPGESRGLCIG